MVADFNEMNERLRGASSREQRVRELAQSLFKRGLAMTQASARQLAESMVDTERRVQQRFEAQKEGATKYPRRVHREEREVPLAGPVRKFMHHVEEAPRRTPEAYKSENGDAIKERVRSGRPVSVQAEYDTPRRDTTTGGKGAAWVPEREQPTTREQEASTSTRDDDDFVELRPEMTVAEAVAGVGEEAVGDVGADEYVELSAPCDHAVEPGDEAVSGEEVFVADGAGEADVHGVVDELEEESGSSGDDEGDWVETPAAEPEAEARVEEEPEPEVQAESAPEPAPELEPAPAYDAEPEDAPVEEVEPEEDAEPEYESEPKAEPEAEESAPAVEHEEDLDAVEEVEVEPGEEATLEEAPAAEAEPEPEPEREDLGKKHGVDLSSIFDVNK